MNKRMMSSTGEVKDAVRLAQQYNIHIYRYLINGLGNSSQKSAQLKVELDVYTRSSMKLFDRLYQIRDSKIPSMRVREEQINVFREEVKRNEKLVQEVHNIQRALWNQRAMGQKIPLANKHLILQAFPELCVSTRPDNVPLTVLCEQIIHKYSLHNDRERCVMDMLRWADEERMARRRSNQALSRIGQGNTGRLVTKSVMKENKPATDNTEVNEVTPVQSWDDLSEEVIQPVTSDETKGHSTLTTVNDVISNTNTDIRQDTQQPVIISLEDSKNENTVISELMIALQDIPELGALLDTPVTNNDHSTVSQLGLNSNTGQLQKPDTFTQTVTNTSSINKDTSKNKSEDDHLDYKENIQCKYNPRGRQTLSWDEIMKRFSKPAEPRKVSNVVSQVEPVTKSYHQVKRSSEYSESNALIVTTESSSVEIKDPLMSNIEPDQTTEVFPVTSNSPKCDAVQNKTSDSFARTSVTVIKNVVTETEKTIGKVEGIQPLVGTDQPHVYENIIKKRKQHGPTLKVNSMTSSEADEFKKKREEALKQLELKKQRTKTILNNQYDKAFPKKSSVHYFKVQSLPKIDKFSWKTSSIEPSKYKKTTTPVLTNTSKGVISTTQIRDLTSRKRPASSINSVSCKPAPKRPRRPRIILKIFRDDDDWNVEQVIDRD